MSLSPQRLELAVCRVQAISISTTRVCSPSCSWRLDLQPSARLSHFLPSPDLSPDMPAHVCSSSIVLYPLFLQMNVARLSCSIVARCPLHLPAISAGILQLSCICLCFVASALRPPKGFPWMLVAASLDASSVPCWPSHNPSLPRAVLWSGCASVRSVLTVLGGSRLFVGLRVRACVRACVSSILEA
jgi:hypothetical protein